MRFEITTDSYVHVPDAKRLTELTIPKIPGTTNHVTLDTDESPGKEIWDGYVEMNQDAILTVENFREALNQALIFFSGVGRDNYPQVTAIKQIEA